MTDPRNLRGYGPGTFLTDPSEDLPDTHGRESKDLPDTGLMPWKETDVQKERVKFVLEWERRWDAGEGLLNFSQLCREFGVSRDTRHRWVRRYRDAGQKVAVLASRSSRPKTMPTKVAVEVEDEIVKLRKQYPELGRNRLWRDVRSRVDVRS